ncbi:MAG: YeeE/YedE family protein [Gammaproteobacteria bacterium]|nr:YeeE/YedE family protein [Gammaproteobacteria bacterium]
MIATEFSPWASLAGGILIGLSAAVLMLGLGRILGATGILAGLAIPDNRSEFAWRATLVLGMIAAPVVIFLFTGRWPVIDIPVSLPMIIVGGVLVGFGASVGSGCTSGHGVCGMARFSRRSILAVLTFMTTAAVTVYLIRHVTGGW